jgi:hypothetical protein
VVPRDHGRDRGGAGAHRDRGINNPFGIFDTRFGICGPDARVVYRAVGGAITCSEAVRSGADDIVDRHSGRDAARGHGGDSGEAHSSAPQGLQRMRTRVEWG